MDKSLEDYLTESEKKVMQVLEKDYKETLDKISYQSAQELLSIAEARRRMNKLKRERL